MKSTSLSYRKNEIAPQKKEWFFRDNKQGRLSLFNRNIPCVKVVFAGTWLLDKNAVLSFGKTAMCKQHSHLCRIFKEYCFGALDVALFWHEFCILKKGSCKLKSTLHMAQEYCLLEGVPYHLEEGVFFRDAASFRGFLHNF